MTDYNQEQNNDINDEELLNQLRKSLDMSKSEKDEDDGEIDINNLLKKLIQDNDDEEGSNESMDEFSEDDYGTVAENEGAEMVSDIMSAYDSDAELSDEDKTVSDDEQFLDTENIIAELSQIIHEGEFVNEYNNSDEFFELANSLAEEEDEIDKDILIALGLEDELIKNLGEENATKIIEDFEAEQEEIKKYEKIVLPHEYTDRSQTAEIVNRYKQKYSFLKIKLLLSFALTLCLMFYENLPVIGLQFGGAFDPAVYPVVYIMIDLQLILLCCALAYQPLIRGIVNVFKGKPSPETLSSILVLFTVVYSILMSNLIAIPDEPQMFSFPVALTILLTLIFEFFNLKREIFSFNIVSAKKPKYVLRRLRIKDAAKETEAFNDITDDMGDVLKIEKTSFVDGYFYRTEKRSSSTGTYTGLLICLTLALSALIALIAGLEGADAETIIKTAYIALAGAIPSSLLLTFSYPLYRANKFAYENDSTIIGESSLEEYSGATMISFDDKNVFPSFGVKVQNVRIYNNYRIDRVLYYAASVFAKAGGPLSDVFEMATMEMGHSDSVEIKEVGDGFIEAEVDGKNILFGRAPALILQGIDISEEITDEDDENGDLSIMYMVFQKKLVAKMHIKYIIDSDFEFIMKQLGNSGMYICVKTFDPNIDEDMIRCKVRYKKYPLRVTKYQSSDEIGKFSEKSDGGIVTRGTAKALLQTVSYCDKILNVKKTNTMLSILSVFISIVVLAIILVSNNLGALLSLFVAANQLFWLIPQALTSKFIVG